MTIKEVKKDLGLTDNDIAEFFQYKNHMAYRNSTARPRVENGLVKFYECVKGSENAKKLK